MFHTGTDEELQTRLTRFDDHINTRKQKRRQEDTRKQDLEDDLANARKQHIELVKQHGGLVAEAEVSLGKFSPLPVTDRIVSARDKKQGWQTESISSAKSAKNMGLRALEANHSNANKSSSF